MSIPNTFPACCVSSVDLLQHKTPADFVSLVQHEIDLYEEGEETDIQTIQQLAECKRFIKRSTT